MPPSEPKKIFILLFPLVFALLFAFATAQRYHANQWTPKDPCPTSIRANVPSSPPFSTYEAVHNAMKTCSNITELYLSTWSGSCTVHPDGYNLPFKTDGSDRYLSAPHILSLERYEFHTSEWGDICPKDLAWANEDGTWPVSNSTNSLVRWTTDMFYRSRWHLDRIAYEIKDITGLGGYSVWRGRGRAQRWYDQRYISTERLSMDNMQLWLEAMDFSKVHTLSIKDSGIHPEGKGLFVDLPPALTDLETLSIRGRWLSWRTYLEQWEAAPGPFPKNKWLSSPPPPARDFILALHPSLKNLTWTDSGTLQEDVFDSVLKHHGSSLKHLQWTNQEDGWKPRPILSDDQLQGLGTWAPGLTSLAIDLEKKNGTWPQDQLKIVAKNLPQLKNLVVYLNLLDEGLLLNGTSSTVKKNHMANSVLDAEEGLKLFQTLRKFKDGNEFDTVEFRQGDWAERPAVYYPFEGVELMVDRFWVTCGMKEGGEGSPSRCEAGYEEGFDPDREVESVDLMVE